MSLCDLYHSYHYFVTEESGCLLVGFREDSVTFIVKEVWNKEPVGLPEVDRLYTEMQRIEEMCGLSLIHIFLSYILLVIGKKEVLRYFIKMLKRRALQYDIKHRRKESDY